MALRCTERRAAAINQYSSHKHHRGKMADKKRVAQMDGGVTVEQMTDFDRGLIVGFHRAGKSVPEIVKMTGLPQRFVKRFLKDWDRGVIDAYTGLYKDGTALSRDSDDSANEG